jgi:hypothetical protein
MISNGLTLHLIQRAKRDSASSGIWHLASDHGFLNLTFAR